MLEGKKFAVLFFRRRLHEQGSSLEFRVFAADDSAHDIAEATAFCIHLSNADHVVRGVKAYSLNPAITSLSIRSSFSADSCESFSSVDINVSKEYFASSL